jgi:hypothetical protein
VSAKSGHSRRRGERIDTPHLDAPGTKGAVEFASGIEQHAERRIEDSIDFTWKTNLGGEGAFGPS